MSAFGTAEVLRGLLAKLDLPLRVRPGWLRTNSGSKIAGIGDGEMSRDDAHDISTAINAIPGLLDEIVRLRAALSTQPEAQLDEAAVDAFAAAMKAKLAEARAKGRGGWRDKSDCPQQRLSDMLRSHVEKGDPRDVANFACFLWNRGEGILPAAQPEAMIKPLAWDAGDGEWLCDKGFHILFDESEPEERRYCATWGEGEPYHFATLEEAKDHCAREWSDFVGLQIAPQQPEAQAGGEVVGNSGSVKQKLPARKRYPKPDENGNDTGPCCAHAYADGWNECLDAIKDTTPPPSAVPEGWKLVPVEAPRQALEAILRAGNGCTLGCRTNEWLGMDWRMAREIYDAMLAAAPGPKENDDA